ncbi:MAG: UvrB/UvrC motif-containing protein, partial [Hungatella sp.]
CADCYSVFDVLIHDNIKQLQGSECHKGKHPVYPDDHTLPADMVGGHVVDQNSVESELRTWNLRLREALKNEEYETAAECRDKIKELKEGNQTNA